MYATWLRQAPGELTVVPVQLPGRERRIGEASEPNLTRLVAQLAAVMTPHTTQPYSFFGHSVGALVAFELARELRRQGAEAPRHLFLSGRGAPGHAAPARQIHMLPDRAFIDEIRAFGGTPPGLLDHPEFGRLFLPPLRADFALLETYRFVPEAPLASPISVFGGLADTVPRHALDAWRAHTRGPFHLRVFPGGHFFLHEARVAILTAVTSDLIG